MSEQIHEVARLHGITVMGVSDTEDRRVRVLYISAPSARRYGDIEEQGQLSPRMVLAFGHLLVDLGEAMLKGELAFNANK
jgi:hypothetical protein